MIDGGGSKKQLTEELENILTLFDNAPFIYHSLDESGNFIAVNDAWCKALGYSRDEVLGRNITEFLHPDYREIYKENFPKFKEKGYIRGFEFGMIKKDGSDVFVSVGGNIGYNEDGTIRQTHCILNDITKNKQAEEELRQSKERYRKFISNSLIGIYCFRMNPPMPTDIPYDEQVEWVLHHLRIEECNDVYARMYGFSSAAELVRLKIVDLVGGDEQIARGIIRTWIEGGYAFSSTETEEAMRSGEHVWFLNSAVSIFEDGRILLVWGTQIDITERKQAEESLHENEEKFRKVLSSTPDAIMLFDAETRQILDVNEAAVRLYGYNREEFLKLKHTAITANKGASDDSIKDLLSGKLSKVPLRYHKKKDGTVFPVEISGSTFSLKGRKVICGSIRDISERMQTEEQIQKSKETVEKYLSIAAEIILSLDANGNITMLNESGHEILGYKNGELVGKNWFKTCLPEVAGKDVYSVFKKLMRGEIENVKTYENPIVTKNGNERIILWHNTVLHDESGNISGTLSSGEDITERKKAEEAVRERQEFINALIDTSQEWIWAIDLQGKHTYCNPAIESILGYSPEDMIGYVSLNLMHDEDRKLIEDKLSECIEKKCGWTNLLIRWRHKDGSWRYLESNAVPILDTGNSLIGFRGVDRDITERKKAEEARVRLTAILETTSDLVSTSTPDGRITFMNVAGKRMLGRPENENFDKYMISDLHPDGANHVIKNEGIPAAIEHGVWEGVTALLRSDGAEIPVSQVIMAHKAPNGEVEYLSTIIRDITEQKQAEERLRKSAIIVNSTTDAVITTDLGGIVTSWNKGAELIYKYTSDEIIGKPVSKLWRKEDLPKLESLIADLIAGEDIPNYEGICLDKYGHEVSVLLSLTPIKDETGNITELVGITKDITDRKRAEGELLLKNIVFDTSIVANSTADLKGIINQANASFVRMWGYKNKNEVIGKPILHFLQNVKEAEVIISSLDKTGEWVGEYTARKKDGSTFIANANATILYDETGKKVGYQSSVQDITERKRVEEAIRQSEKRFRDLAEMLPEAVFETDRNINLTFANRHAFELFGYSDEDLKRGLNGLELIAPVDRNRVKANIARRLMGEEPGTVEYQALKKDGSSFPILFHASSIMKDGELIGLRGVIVDITERKRAEKQLQNSKETAESYLNVAAEIILSLNTEGTITMLNESGHNILGYEVGDLVGKDWFETCLPRRQRKDVRTVFEKLMRGEIESVKTYESTIVTKNGSEKIILWHNTLLKNESGNICGTLSSGEDITESKRAAEELRMSEERFRSYISNAPNAIFVVNAEGRYIEVNEAACRMTGYKKSELTNMSIPDLSNPQTLQEDFEIFGELKKTGKICTEIRLKRKDGSIIWVSLDAVALAQDRFMAFCSDITETKRLRELESRAARLETAGTIAGQVAHDLNNLLAPVMAYPDFIREELPSDNIALTYIDDIEEAAEKIADINQDLLTLGRRGHYTQDVLNLNRLVLQAIQEKELRSKAVVCETELCEDLMNIKGGVAQIHRMLVNLIVNALDAMRDMGKIIIRTENYYADETSIAFGRIPRGEYVRLTISDNGCGIPEDIVQKVFDPFFSTKTTDKKRGSGLGLSIVDAVMKDHNGYLDLSSKIGYGTSFYLYFPVTREDSEEIDSRQLTGGTESLLVVDDDDVQRKVTSQLLNKLGYRVTTVNSGEQAIEFLKENSRDLVILDMVMPGGIDGAETYQRILEINPRQKAIILSGFSESDRVLEAQKLGAGEFVRKPITKRVIAAAVRSELDR